MKLKIGTKIALGFTIVLAFLMAISVNSIVMTRSIEADVKEVVELNRRLTLDKDIEIRFYNSVAAIRGYIAYGNDRFKEDYEREMAQVLELEKKLYDITRRQEVKDRVQELIITTTRYHQGIRNELIPAVERQFRGTGQQAGRDEVVRIAGGLVPITGQITDMIQWLVRDNTDRFNSFILSANDRAHQVMLTSAALSVVSLLAGVVLSFLITGSIKRPILGMVDGANRFARGDFTGEIKVKSSDELGDLAVSLNTMAGQLRDLISGVVASAQTLAAHSQELAASAEEVNATVEEVAGTTGEVAAMAEKSLENAREAARESRKAVGVAESGGKTVQKTIDKITSISESAARVNDSVQNLGQLSAKIGNITDVITGIADQTNLLALNAAIEAARAGEQGRGFAVVAEEVRKLAEQSAAAAREIGQLINQIQSGVDAAIQAMKRGAVEVGEGVSLASGAGAALNDIIEAVNRNILLVEEITLGAGQTSEGTRQLAAGNEQVSSTIQQVAGATQELAEIAARLQAAVAQFKV
ncbi:MAG: methyl-accepting chemotaxis protein [Peptococcaceae bacterium]|nr:methyl-accepting chemotaxis protein [Peptococcaceae bacterium]